MESQGISPTPPHHGKLEEVYLLARDLKRCPRARFLKFEGELKPVGKLGNIQAPGLSPRVSFRARVGPGNLTLVKTLLKIKPN